MTVRMGVRRKQRRMCGRPPLIVLGAHRSGTTLAVRLLEKLGVFMGSNQDANGEPYYFARRNEWALRRAGGAWDHPLPLQSFLRDRALLEAMQDVLAVEIASLRFAGFTGPGRFLRTLGSRSDRQPWGWKDPRNTFTLPLWSRIFPGARLLLVERNGVDAAQSLHVREREARRRAAGDLHLRMSPLPRRLLQAPALNDRLEPYFTFSPRLSSWEGAFGLWEEYVAEGRAQLDAHDGPSFRLRYEDLLREPLEQLAGLASFCGLEPSREELEGACQELATDRGFAFTADADLLARYQSVKGSRWMRELGYDQLPVTASARPTAR